MTQLGLKQNTRTFVKSAMNHEDSPDTNWSHLNCLNTIVTKMDINVKRASRSTIALFSDFPPCFTNNSQHN